MLSKFNMQRESSKLNQPEFWFLLFMQMFVHCWDFFKIEPTKESIRNSLSQRLTFKHFGIAYLVGKWIKPFKF